MEGTNISIEYRPLGRKLDRLASVLAEPCKLKIDVLYVASLTEIPVRAVSKYRSQIQTEEKTRVNKLHETRRGRGSDFFMTAELLPYKRNYSPSCLDRRFPLFLRVGLERNGRRSKSIGISCGNVVLIQDASRTDMGPEIRIDLRALLRQLRYRMDRDGAPSLSSEKPLESLLAGLFGHKAGIGIVLSRLMFFGNINVVLGLAKPA